ncbi:MAG TPA: GNAT family N-acetyltransferase [Dyadobacter sp.]|jgi:RimJ/RimL family protein N-acetyltransferase|nr:GNAT family N-acetyltransferase [Dyadobacter sp.]
MSSNLLRTKRFVLVKMADGDQSLYYSISCNQNVMKYVTGYALSRRESDEMFRCIVEDNAEDEILGRYFIKDRHNGEVIGAAKLDQIGQEIEIGYRIREEYWGQGIATEVTKGLIRFAYDGLGIKRVIAFVNVENAASIRVLEKAGMLNTALIEDIDEVKYKFTYLHQSLFTLKRLVGFIVGLIILYIIATLVMPQLVTLDFEQALRNLKQSLEK